MIYLRFSEQASHSPCFLSGRVIEVPMGFYFFYNGDLDKPVDHEIAYRVGFTMARETIELLNGSRPRDARLPYYDESLMNLPGKFRERFKGNL